MLWVCLSLLSAFAKSHRIDRWFDWWSSTLPGPNFSFISSLQVYVCVMCMCAWMNAHICLCGCTCTCVHMQMEVQGWCWMSSLTALFLLRYGLWLSRAHQILASLASWFVPGSPVYLWCWDPRWLSHMIGFLYGLCISRLHSSYGMGKLT